MEKNRHTSKVLKWSVTIGIIIVLNLFFNYAISLIYPAPDYLKYCPTEQVVNPPVTKQACLSVGGQWNETTYPQGSVPVAVSPTTGKSLQVTGYCDQNYTCQKNFDADNKVYERNVFIALVALGVVSIVLGLFLKVTDAVTIGLSFGGILSLIIASVRYWSQAQNVLKVCILAVALIALIWVGIKKFQE